MSQAGPSPPSPAVWLCGLLGPVIFLCSISLGTKIKNWEIPHKIKMSAFPLEAKIPVNPWVSRTAWQWLGSVCDLCALL